MIDLTTQLGPLTLQNPITVASGTFGSKDEFSELVDYNKVGGVITKSISLEPYTGNPMPRICETPSGMLNAIGLQNDGLDDFIKNKIPYFEDISTALIMSVAGKTIEEFVQIAERLDQIKRVDAIEMNISCPNVKQGGIAFALDHEATERLVAAVRAQTKKPLIVKLSPEGDIVKSAQAAIAGGADILSLINTIRGIAVDIKTRKPLIANITGGLSGPAIKPIALRCLYEVRKAFPKIPIIAKGGIMNIEDIIEFMIVGADAVSLGTVNFVYPTFADSAQEQLTEYCKKENISSCSEIKNSMETI